MKKIISLALATALVISSFVCVCAADEGIKVYLEGSKINFDVQPQTINDRTMVPIRAIFEAMGANVTWDDATQTAISAKDNTTVKMTLNSTTEYINDVAYQMDVTPVIIDGRTLAPARYVAEAFGYYVNWDEMTKSVLISKNANFDISKVKDGTREHPYKFGDKVSVSFCDPWDYDTMSSLGTYEFTLKSIMSPSDMEKKFDDSYYSYDSERWYLNATISLLSYNKNDVCSFQDMIYDSKIVTSDFVPGTYYSWYVDPSNYRFVELYSGGSTECYIPLQKDEIAEGQTADYFTITYYSNKDTKETIWFSLKEITDSGNSDNIETKNVLSSKNNSTQSTANNTQSDFVVTEECKSALKKARTYSDLLHMSKASIYTQLTSEYGEKFTAEEAQYAIDNLQVDYKNNALEKAKSYRDTMNMSKARIYDQLISEYGEKFTAEEAQYAIDNLE